ncbi:pentapeptide repeat-containing protein [Thermocoleostomius sinensis]|uniref:Pentapeptide repeat-containing protein n=1 Tax=Thermocoleostomius sinensis A174 TaxID=2016057 RepID=A0A9E8ZE22_9CYAN|nr:pentapeptide repeat-containing protein [Thermocoleostomius sinensis]WAL61629.1 pentapeptide repeat-containing protein [Thermocoleostomius sinensis A174]
MKNGLPFVPAVLAFGVITTGFVLPANAENHEHVQQLLQTRHCSSCDLSRVGLVYSNLADADLSQANLSQANLSRANLTGANLSGANLTGATLVHVNLSGADLTGADLRGADLRGAILTGANVAGARLDEVNLLGAVGLPREVATPEQLYRLGLAEVDRGHYRGAIDQFNQVLQLDPSFAHAYLARGIAWFQLGERSAALEDARQAEQLYLAQTNEDGYRIANQLSQGIVAIQEVHEKQQEQMQGNGIGTSILNLLGVAASLFLRFGL